MLENAQRDHLTGFFTRGALDLFLGELTAKVKSKGGKFSLALIDLDHFKKFNDKFGHKFGDEILQYTTSTLRMVFSRQECYFFRYGGDEFICVFPNIGHKEALSIFKECHSILNRRPFLFDNRLHRVTLSSGIASFPSDVRTVGELIKEADRAMYFSKHSGRNTATSVSQILYLKLRKLIISIVCGAIALCLLLLAYNLTFKAFIQPTFIKMKDMKVITKPRDLDTVVLKNGFVFEGYILSEAEHHLILSLYCKKGEAIVTFKESDIEKIKYGTTKNKIS